MQIYCLTEWIFHWVINYNLCIQSYTDDSLAYWLWMWVLKPEFLGSDPCWVISISSVILGKLFNCCALVYLYGYNNSTCHTESFWRINYIIQMKSLKAFLGNNKSLARISSYYKQCCKKHPHVCLITFLHYSIWNIQLKWMRPRYISIKITHILII